MVETKDIAEQNLWWRISYWSRFDKHLLMLKEQNFKVSRKKLESKQVNLIYGPRQVGKTTFLKLMIQELIEKGTDPQKIAYFSCDALLTNKREELREVISFLLQKPLEFLLIDEISNVRDWGYEIKYFIDSGKLESLRVFITGSPLGMGEYLPGRKLAYSYLMPLSFREFLENMGRNINEETKRAFDLKKVEIEEIKALLMILPTYEFKDLEELKEKMGKAEIYHSILGKLFYFYILVGGFPSVINSYIRYKLDKNRIYLMDEVKTNKERLIDSLRKRGRNEGICFQLIGSIKKRVSSRYSFTELKETEIDLSKETIINYLGYLRNIFLLKIVYAYVFGREEVGWKKNKKIYLIDPFLYHEDRIYEEGGILSDEEYISKIVESMTAISLSYVTEDFLNPLETFLYFWYNTKEIDFIFKSNEFFAIEVKFRKKVGKVHKVSQLKNYIVLTKELAAAKDNEVYIPVFLFLALLKSKECYQ